MTRTSLDPNAEGDRSNMWHLFGQDGETVGQDFTPDVAQAFHNELAGSSYEGDSL